MATTTNYGWTTPDDTDLVKDGAAAIRTLGSSIDTSFAADEGDLLVGGTSDIFEALPIGASGTVLTSDGDTAEWAAPATGGAFTSLASGSLSGSSVVLGSIPATFTDLRLDVFDYYASSNAFLELIITGITSNYFGVIYGNENNSPFGPSTTSGGYVGFKSSANNADNNNRATYYFNAYADTTSRRLISATDIAIVGAAVRCITKGEYSNTSTAAISSLTIAPSAGTFSGGTYELYGVK